MLLCLAEALLLSTHCICSWGKSTLCGALHSLLNFAFKILDCVNLKKRCLLHVLCIFHVILNPAPRIFARTVCEYMRTRACVLTYVFLKQ